jgi:hypothetical protein
MQGGPEDGDGMGGNDLLHDNDGCTTRSHGYLSDISIQLFVIQGQPVIRNKFFIFIVLPRVESCDIHFSCSKHTAENFLASLTTYTLEVLSFKLASKIEGMD